jgi:hypothetical protein
MSELYRLKYSLNPLIKWSEKSEIFRPSLSSNSDTLVIRDCRCRM